MSDEQQRPVRPWLKVAGGLVLGLLVGVALWLTVPHGPVLNAVGLEPPWCAEAVSTYEREMDKYTRQLREHENRQVMHDIRPQQGQQQHREGLEELFREAFNSLETAALVAEQNPDCFSAEERATVEQRYRSGQRAMERRGY